MSGFVQWDAVGHRDRCDEVVWRSNILLGFALIVSAVLGVFVRLLGGGVYAHSDMANQLQRDAMELETLPNISKENVRVLPRSVSDRYT